MRKWQGLSMFALLCGAVGVACGSTALESAGSASLASTGTTSTSTAVGVSASDVPAANTANLDAVMRSTVTQSYLTAASKDKLCANNANQVMQMVHNVAANLGDANAVWSDSNNIATMDANSAVVIRVFEQDLPQLRNAMQVLASCVQSRCGGHDIPDMPTFPCGKPGSSTFPNSDDGNHTSGCGSHDGSTTSSSTTSGSTTGSTTHGTTTAGSTTGSTTHGTTTAGSTTGGTTSAGNTTGGTAGTTTGSSTTTGSAGTTTAGSTTGSATGGTAGTTTGSSTTTGSATAGTTTGSTAGTTTGSTAGTTTGSSTSGEGTTTGVITEPNNVLPNAPNLTSCISVVYSGRGFVACGVNGL